MLNLIQKFFKKDIFNRQQVRSNFNHYFFSMPEHEWIGAQEKVHFEALIQLLPVGLLDVLMKQYPVSFLPSVKLKDRDSVGHSLKNSVYIFPEFHKLLKSDKKSAVAYLAHELAFVLYELEETQSNSLMAEVEADKFVCDLGLTFELEELLLMLDETIEKRLRLTYLTINHFSREDN